MTFPFAMLSHLYEVDAPGTLGPSAFSVAGAGSSAATTVTVDDAGHVVHVDISGMTFSKRHLKVVGDMRPGGVRNLRAIRVSGSVESSSSTRPLRTARSARLHGEVQVGVRSRRHGIGWRLPVEGHRAQPRREVPLQGLAKSRFGDGAKRGVDMPRS
jgi:hypothetical protein